VTPDEIRDLVKTQMGAARRLRTESGEPLYQALRSVQSLDSTILLAEIAAQLAEFNARLAHHGEGLNVGLCSTNDTLRVQVFSP
jgi:hypothetical protein